jgi:OOP family OmpA-OmpF porin
MRPIALAFAAVFFAIGAGVAWLIASSTLTWVENSEQAELEQVFYAGGIDWATGEADGFVVTLRGVAESEADQARAHKIATLVFADNLRDETTVNAVEPVLAEGELPFVEILKNGTDLAFLGRMPQGDTTQVFARYIASLGPDYNVSNVTEPVDNTPENWLPAFEFALRLAPLTTQSIFNVSPGKVSLEAVAMSASWRQGFEEMAEGLRPEGVVLEVKVSAARPIISPYSFVFDVATPEAAICAAKDEAEATRIAATLEQLIGGRVKCDIGLGAPSTQWRTAVEAGLKALADLGGGRLEIIDADVALIAPAEVPRTAFEQVAQGLSSALPEGFSLHATAPDAPPRRVEIDTQPMEFTATLDSDGQAVIEGAVKDTLTREVVMRFSEAKFGYGRVEDRMWLDNGLPDGWQVRVFKLIEALALLNEGSATMTPDSLDIGGDASFENPAEELGKLLAGAYGPDEATLVISYTEPVAGQGGRGLDPRLCVSRVSKILADNSIVFAPSSAVISDPSMPTIAAIADVLTQCRDARIEIGGHTDSQGREEMNRALSQGRADAVLDALLSRNLLLGELSAKGYGESEPIADNSTEEGRAANRRIEFKLIRNAPEPSPEPSPEPAPGAAPVGAGQVAPNDFTRPALRARTTEDASQ